MLIVSPFEFGIGDHLPDFPLSSNYARQRRVKRICIPFSADARLGLVRDDLY
jgi:hypothetical protein